MPRDMKNSGISWIGEIPVKWSVHPLKYDFQFIAGATPDSANANMWDGDVLWITPADYKTKDIYVSGGSRNLSDLGYKSCSTHMLPTGTIVVSKRAPIGSVAVTTKELCTNQGCLGLVRKCEDTSEKYYYYALSIYDDVLNLYGSGTTFKEISATVFSNIKMVAPPSFQQKSIVAFLDSKCAEIDALSSDIQSEIEILEAYKRSVITEAVTKGLDKNVPMKESGIEWAEKVPAHWKVMQNKYIMKKIKNICPVYNGEDILSLTMNGVIVRDLDAGGKMPASFNGYQSIYPGNLLMCLFDYDVTPRCIGLIKNEGLTSPAYSQFVMKNENTAEYYYYYYLMIDFTKELLHLAKNLRHSFTEDQLGTINAPVPPIDEQMAIAKYLDNKCAEIETIIAQKQEQLAVLADYKKSVIYEYVTGKKEVPVA